MEALMKALIFAALPTAALLIATPAGADQFSQVNDPAPGAASLLNSDYANAEREIRAANVSKYDPARSINLGIALAKQGRRDDAAKQFNRVLMEQDVEMVVADGQTVMSHEVAQRALTALENGVLSR
jgi:Flp pilus assembly protein TadD